ncbi:MAG: glycosyl transferase, partial [Gemmatimonadaceae bacterium]|nr:glycosyl transferase [Gemmatimonadaceae bacterium]
MTSTVSRSSLGFPPVQIKGRVVARGKFLYVDGKKFYIRGVTYGPLSPDESGNEYKSESDVSRDFAAMAAAGVNLVRTHTAVPRWLLDCAE